MSERPVSHSSVLAEQAFSVLTQRSGVEVMRTRHTWESPRLLTRGPN